MSPRETAITFEAAASGAARAVAAGLPPLAAGIVLCALARAGR